MAIKLHNTGGSVTISQKLAKGDDGGYYIPLLDDEGNLTWQASEEDMPEIEGANIKGQKGDKGDTGKDGVTPVYIGTDESQITNDTLIWFYTEPDAVSSAEEVEY